MEEKIWLGNAFSIQMISEKTRKSGFQVNFIPVEKLPDVKNLESAVGHADLACILGVKYNRASIVLEKGDYMYIVQVVGGRLPEGCTELPEGTRLEYFRVEIL
jgi:hypothetical protein